MKSDLLGYDVRDFIELLRKTVPKSCYLSFIFLISMLFLSSFEAQADGLFSKFTLEGQTGPHLVLKSNINVRAYPSTKGKKRSKLRRRETVEVLGKAKGTQWLAVQKDGQDLGFVYGAGLAPLIDGSLDAPLLGRVDMSKDHKPICTYKIIFDQHTMEEEIVFVSSDYQVKFSCQYETHFFDFSAMIFMSEIPFNRDRKPIYQINLDLPEITTGYEDFLSASSSFHVKKGKVILDRVSLKAFKENDLTKELPAQTPQEALNAATKLHLMAFNTKAWRIISGQTPNPNDTERQ